MSTDLSFRGSCERDLVKSKVWLCDNLPNKTWGDVYVLGSWYGNMGLIMHWASIDFRRITNVDLDLRYCKQNRLIYEKAGFKKPYRILHGDCNRIDLSGADLVINTSTNDIPTHRWFKHIPNGCVIAIQGRNNQPDDRIKDRPDGMREFIESFPLRQILMKGKISLGNEDERYDRYMLIGCK